MKNAVTVLIFLAIIFLPNQASASMEAGPHGEGDPSGDGIVSALDTLILINIINSGEEPEQDILFRGDVAPGYVVGDDVYCATGDSLITSADVLVLINMINALETNFAPLDSCGYDFDQDGFVDEYSPGGVDCDDTDPDVYPGAEDQCDGIDQGCDGLDGVPEIPDNGIDDDCDGRVDEGCFIGMLR